MVIRTLWKKLRTDVIINIIYILYAMIELERIPVFKY